MRFHPARALRATAGREVETNGINVNFIQPAGARHSVQRWKQPRSQSHTVRDPKRSNVQQHEGRRFKT